jgi:4-amino-4-deoxy-L-arabinose transferase-like glycosyltransferase
LIFILMAHWLVALKPEVSSDGLAMHLALPMQVAQETKWDFDFQQKAWAVMPIGGDSLYTAAYLFGGELAARLANLGMLLLIVALIVSACRRWLTVWQAFLTAALFVSTPLVQLVTGSLFVENVWGALVVGAMLALARFWESGDAAEVPIAGLLLGAAIAVKLMAIVFLLPAAVLGLAACWRHKKLAAFAAGAVLIAVLGSPPYLYAWAKTGNPVFPFANTIFRSPYYPSPFVDPRFDERLSWKTPYDMTFHSARYFEGQGGGTGFQFLVLLLPALLLLRKRFPWLLAGAGASVILVLLIVLPNFRYLYPALPLLSIAIGNILVEWPVLGSCAMAGITVLNLYFLPASGWYHRDFAFFKHSDARAYVERAAPIRSLIAFLNHN